MRGSEVQCALLAIHGELRIAKLVPWWLMASACWERFALRGIRGSGNTWLLAKNARGAVRAYRPTFWWDRGTKAIAQQLAPKSPSSKETMTRCSATVVPMEMRATSFCGRATPRVPVKNAAESFVRYSPAVDFAAWNVQLRATFPGVRARARRAANPLRRTAATPTRGIIVAANAVRPEALRPSTNGHAHGASPRLWRAFQAHNAVARLAPRPTR